MLLVEIVQEVDEMLGIEKKDKRPPHMAAFGDELVKGVKEMLDPKGPMKIGDLNIGDEGITIEAEILEIARHAGTTKDGNAYEKASLMLSDKSGPIKLVLWNEQIAEIGDLQPNDVIRVEAWKVEKGYKGGVHELVYGKFGTINKVNIERHII